MLDTRLAKATKDLLLRKGRTALAVFGLAIGLWGVTTVAVSYSILSHDLSANFVGTNPPSIVVETAPTTREQRAALEAVEGVARVENRPLAAGRIELRPGVWLPLYLFVVEAFETMSVARIEPEEGAWPPSPGTLLIERDGRLLVRFFSSAPPVAPPVASPGPGAAEGRQSVRVRLSGGPPVAVELSGTVFDPGRAPSRMEQTIYGYAEPATAATLGAGIAEDRLLITVEGDPEDDAAVRVVADRVATELAALGVDARAWNLPAYQHPHQFQMRSILVLLGALGGLALLMSTVLVVDLIQALLAAQIRQIGVLKAIGAGTRQVAWIYLASMAILGAAAAIVAVPLGVSTGWRLAGGISSFLNFELLTPSLPVGTYLALALLGPLLPVLAALWPIRRGAAATVLEALSSHGVDAADVPRGGPLPLPLPLAARMALGNALRRRGRLATTILTLGLGTVLFMVAMNLRESLLQTADTVEATKRHDLVLELGEMRDNGSLVSRIEGMENVVAVESWIGTSGGLTAGAGPDPVALAVPGNRFGVRVVPETTAAVRPYLLAGRWLDAAEPDGVVVNQKLLGDHPELEVGGAFRLEIGGRALPVRLAGVVKEFGPSALYLGASLYAEHFGVDGRSNRILVSLEDRSTSAQRAAKTALEAIIARSDLDVQRILTATIAALIIRNHLEVIGVVLAVVALMMMLVSGLGMASSLGVSVAERTREIGVLRAIGGRPWTVRSMLALEAMLVATMAWGVAALVATPASRAAAGAFGTMVVEYPFDYRTSFAGMGAALGVAVVLAIVASWGAARRATRQPVREALSYE